MNESLSLSVVSHPRKPTSVRQLRLSRVTWLTTYIPVSFLRRGDTERSRVFLNSAQTLSTLRLSSESE